MNRFIVTLIYSNKTHVNVLKENTAPDRQTRAGCDLHHAAPWTAPESVCVGSDLPLVDGHCDRSAEWALINRTRPVVPTTVYPRQLCLLSIAEQQSNNSHFIHKPPFGTGNELLYNDKTADKTSMEA